MRLEELWKSELVEPIADGDPTLRHPIRRASWCDPTIAVILGPGLTLLIGRVVDVKAPKVAPFLRSIGSMHVEPNEPIVRVKHVEFGLPWAASYEDIIAFDWEAMI